MGYSQSDVEYGIELDKSRKIERMYSLERLLQELKDDMKSSVEHVVPRSRVKKWINKINKHLDD